MLEFKKIKSIYLKRKLLKEKENRIKLDKIVFDSFKTTLKFQDSLPQTILCIDSLDPKNEIILEGSNIYINNKKVLKRNFDFTLYKDCNNLSTLYIRMNSIKFLPGDKILINLKIFNKKFKFKYLDLKVIYLYDNKIFLDFS